MVKTCLAWLRLFRSPLSWATLPVILLALLFLRAEAPTLAQAQGQPRAGGRPQFNVEPFHLLGNIDYVGLSDSTVFLIRSSDGYILLDTASDAWEPEIRQNIESLGVDLRDIKILLQAHAHNDHIGSLAKFKEATGGQVVVMAEDAAALADGAANVFRNRPCTPAGPRRRCEGEPSFVGVPADQVIHDGDEVTLGDVTLVAHLTAGHTKGCTTWSMDTEEAGRTYNVVFICSMRINEDIPIWNNPKYPDMASDFENAFKTLRSLNPDLFFVSHGNQFAMAERIERMRNGEGFEVFDGYLDYVDEYENAFVEQLKIEQAGGPPYSVGGKPRPPCPQDGRRCF